MKKRATKTPQEAHKNPTGKPHSKRATKKVTPSNAFPATPGPQYDADKLLLHALTVNVDDDPKATLEQLAERPEGISNVEILDILAEHWSGGYSDEADGGYYANGGPSPSIYLGQTEKLGKPTLMSDALAQACRRVLNLPDSLTAAARGRREPQEATDPTPATEIVPVTQPPAGEIPIANIIVVSNPRETFEEEPLQELAASIRQFGVLQPLTVSPPDSNGMYTLIAGERRLRASIIAELLMVPVRVVTLNTVDADIARLVENVMREDLTPIEEAKGYAKLLENMTQRELADKLGKTQAHISNRVRLLKLNTSLQQDIIDGRIGQREGRELAAWADRPGVMREFAFQWSKGQTFAESLWLAMQAASRSIDKGSDGPRFKLTDEVRGKLDIASVTIERFNGERAFNVDLWEELQAEANRKREAKKKAATTKGKDDAEPAVDPDRVKELWKSWWARAIHARFNGATKQPDVDLLTKLSIAYSDDDVMYQLRDAFGIRGTVAAQVVGVLQRDTDEILEAVRKRFLDALKLGIYYYGDLPELVAIAEHCGVSLTTWVPDEVFLNQLPQPYLRDLATECELTAEKTVPKLSKQLVGAWEPGWIPEALNVPGLNPVAA